jgi:antitoxin component YwqK of YwqJK toxin-antitoxin module
MKLLNRPLLKRTAFTLLCALATCTSWGQSKKEIKQYDIATTAEAITEYVDGREITRNEAYKKYDKQGNVIEEVDYDKGGRVKERVVRKFNPAGDKTEETTYDATGQLLKRETYRYDDSGLKLEELMYDSQNMLVSRSVFKMDWRGLKTEKKTYDGKGNPIQTKTYRYED